MKMNAYSAVFAAIALAGFSGFDVPFASVPVYAQEAAGIAEIAKNFDPAKNLDLSGKKLIYKRLPAGVKAKIVGTTYEQLIDFDGKIRNPISPKTTKVTFELTDKAGNRAVTPTFELSVPVDASIQKKLSEGAAINSKPTVVPALQEWVGGEGTFVPDEDFVILLSERYADVGNPTLRERVELFAKELSQVFGRKIKIEGKQRPGKKDISVALASEEGLGNLGKEGYVLIADENGLHILASDPLGAFWGTRSILQVFKQNNNTFPCGIAIDYPQYPLRGFMYDLGRKPASLKAVKDVLKTMAYYKMNDYHLHLNDNFIWMYNYTQIPNGKDATPAQKKAACEEILAAAPTAFRLESDVVGKDGTPLTASDLYYTKKEFGKLIDLAKLYGVTIVPEFDVPGHAMSFVRVRPDLMYRGKVTKAHDVERTAMLDASNDVFDKKTGKTYREETLDFVQSVFDEYLVGKNGEEPVFRTPVIHFGTDEYYGDPEDYRAFADAMIKYVKSRGYTPRLWGSLSVKRGKTPVDGTGAQINVWNHGWQNPLLALEHNFDLVNIIDVWAYIVPNGNGNRGGYGDLLDLNFLYSQNWHPHKMSHKEEVVPGFPKMLGASWALWNDNSFRGDTGLTDYDLFDRIRQSCAVFAEKTWNTGEDISFRDFQKLVKNVSYAPLSNPEYLVPVIRSEEAGDVLFELDNPLKGVALKTKIRGVAPDYVATVRVKRTNGAKKAQVLFNGPSGKVFAVQKETGKVGIRRDTWDYSFDYTLPVGREVELTFVAEKRTLTLYADGKKIGSPERHLFPESHKYSTFVFPLAVIGGAGIEVNSVKVVRPRKPGLANVVPESEIKDVTASSEHGKGADGDASALWDGDEATFWHSKYAPEKDTPPFEIVVELKKPTALEALAFLPRPNGGNGNVKHAKLYARVNGAWKQVGKEFRGNGASDELQTIAFPACRTDALKLVILDGVGGFGSIAEIYPIMKK